MKHHIVEMRGDVTDTGQTNDEQLNIELLIQRKLEAESRESCGTPYCAVELSWSFACDVDINPRVGENIDR